MLSSKIKIAPVDESKPDTVFHNWLLIRIVILVTMPAYFALNIFIDQSDRNDPFARYVLLSMLLSISLFLPLVHTLKNKTFLPINQPRTYYVWKFIYSLLAAVASTLVYTTLAPEGYLGAFIYNWIWFPIIIPYCVTSAVLYCVLYARSRGAL